MLPPEIDNATPLKARSNAPILFIPNASLRNMAANTLVIRGLVAPIIDEFTAVVYFNAVKNNALYPNIPTIPRVRSMGKDFFPILQSGSRITINGKITAVAIRNLKKATVNTGSSATAILPAINAPAQQKAAKAINRYIFFSFNPFSPIRF